MVKSGLVTDTTVSHYRLSIHLSMAIIIISTMYWLIKNLHTTNYVSFFEFKKKNLPFQILIILIFAQIIIGAFVSGLDAGRIYQTWPLMGETFFPNDLFIINLDNLINFDNHSLVQFYHRNLAYIIIVYVLILSIYIYKKQILKLYSALRILILILITQIFLGIFTLVSGLNIYLASLHQITGVLLVLTTLNLYYLISK